MNRSAMLRTTSRSLKVVDWVVVVALASGFLLLELDLFVWAYSVMVVAIYIAGRGLGLMMSKRGRRYACWLALGAALLAGSALALAPKCNEWLITRHLAEFRKIAEDCQRTGRAGICELDKGELELVEFARLERVGTDVSIWMHPRNRRGILVFVPATSSGEAVRNEQCVNELAPAWFLLRRC